MGNKALDKSWGGFIRDWLRYKKEAVKTGDPGLYNEFLKIIQKEFSKLYVEATEPEFITLVEQVLKVASCEIKGNTIKYNNNSS